VPKAAESRNTPRMRGLDGWWPYNYKFGLAQADSGLPRVGGEGETPQPGGQRAAVGGHVRASQRGGWRVRGASSAQASGRAQGAGGRRGRGPEGEAGLGPRAYAPG
jgi:hypothetical protein